MRIKKSQRENYGVCVAAEKEICVKLMESHYDGKSVISAFKETAVMDKIWEDLYGEAKKVLKPRKVSEWVEAGGVAAAIEASSGRIYTGVCVDSACTLGICAERNAIFQMLTNGESVIRRVIAVNQEGKAIPPCGACRELMTQLMPEDYKKIEVMLDYENCRSVSLGELTPEWWI
ncbi:MAG: cytidine deaminase family protein [Eisenbergiella sp.]